MFTWNRQLAAIGQTPEGRSLRWLGVLLVSTTLVLPACAARASRADATSYHQARHGVFVAMREFSIRTAPSPEAPVVDRISAGARFAADVDAAADGWTAVRLDGSRKGYVFGVPFERASRLTD